MTKEEIDKLLAGVEMPEPDTHCFDTDTEQDVWSYSRDLLRETVAAVVAKKDAKIASLTAHNESLLAVWRNDGEHIKQLKAEVERMKAATVSEAERVEPVYADPFTYVIQHLNSSPYNMTKAECVSFIKGLRDTYNGVQHDSDCPVNNEPAWPAGPCDCGAAKPVEQGKPKGEAVKPCGYVTSGYFALGHGHIHEVPTATYRIPVFTTPPHTVPADVARRALGALEAMKSATQTTDVVFMAKSSQQCAASIQELRDALGESDV